MRVISGTRRGKKLFSTKDKNTRPTEDRVKEAIFNTLSEIEKDSYVLDLFSGTGGIGIEFLSRGAKLVVFSDLSKNNINCIRDNLEFTGFKDKGKIYTGDYIKNLYRIKNDLDIKFDYIYIDPPYDKKIVYYKSLEIIKKLKLSNTNGVIIIEANSQLDLADYKIIKEKKYGNKIIYFLNLGESYESNISRQL